LAGRKTGPGSLNCPALLCAQPTHPKCVEF
jgi:hypothetical protein